MKLIRDNKKRIITALLIVSVLVIAFFLGGKNDFSNTSYNSGNNSLTITITPDKEDIVTPVVEPLDNQVVTPIVTSELTPEVTISTTPEANINVESTPSVSLTPTLTPTIILTGEATVTVIPTTTPTVAPTKTPSPTPSPTPTVGAKPENEGKVKCIISISCKTILSNMEDLTRGKEMLVPKDGIILKETTLYLEEGESVYDALRKVCKEAKIPVDASYTPGYGSVYVMGINNLYEFDCGSLSGWMYSVNGVYPNYGSSSYIVKDGDVIEWNYTCNMHDL